MAIELAAARLRAMSVPDLASRLQDRFRILTGGDRTALPRQQTLRALIDWSHELLTEAERILFVGCRFSLVAGRWRQRRQCAQAVQSTAPTSWICWFSSPKSRLSHSKGRQGVTHCSRLCASTRKRNSLRPAKSPGSVAGTSLTCRCSRKGAIGADWSETGRVAQTNRYGCGEFSVCPCVLRAGSGRWVYRSTTRHRSEAVPPPARAARARPASALGSACAPRSTGSWPQAPSGPCLPSAKFATSWAGSMKHWSTCKRASRRPRARGPSAGGGGPATAWHCVNRQRGSWRR